MVRYVTLALMLAAPAASAQVPTAPSRDTIGTEIVVLHLGGDSSQVALVSLVKTGPYRLEVRPASAEILVRRRSPTPVIPLALPSRSVTDSGRVLVATPPATAEYFVELTNPAHAATVRIVYEGTQHLVSAEASRAMFEPEARVLDETFPGPFTTMTLGADVAYRVEVRGNGPSISANISIRPLSDLSLPPLVLQPMDVQSASTGGATYLIVPSTTGEYRLDVATSDMVRVQIIRDPRETARWARIGDATRNLPKAGVTVRAVTMGRFPRPPLGFSEIGDMEESGTGADVCLGLVPRGGWAGGVVGGCALELTLLQRPNHSDVIEVAIAPRIVLSPPSARTRVSIGMSGGLATTTNNEHSETYYMFGASAIIERQLLRHWALELEGGPTMVYLMGGANETNGKTSATPMRLAAGLQYRF